MVDDLQSVDEFPASKHPSIQASKHPSIQACKHPSIQASKHPVTVGDDLQSVERSQASKHPHCASVHPSKHPCAQHTHNCTTNSTSTVLVATQGCQLNNCTLPCGSQFLRKPAFEGATTAQSISIYPLA